MPLKPNSGRCPRGVTGKRIRAVLHSGYDTAAKEPAGWPADGKGACNWHLGGSNWDILEWELITWPV